MFCNPSGTKYASDLDLIKKDNFMKPNNHLTKLASHLLMITLATMTVYTFMFPAQVHAQNNSSALPTLAEFIEQVKNGEADTLRGAYIPEVLALSVVQQPGENSNYISPRNSILTQFNMANRAGNVGLLAHNYLAGGLFFEIQAGDLITLVYGDEHTETFAVESIQKYEALPNGIYKNIETQISLDIGKLFRLMYGGERHVTMQTCITKDDNLSWGRLFIIARTVNNEDSQGLQVTIAPPPPAAPPPQLIFGWPLTHLELNMEYKKTEIMHLH
jgi:hypothetical protein